MKNLIEFLNESYKDEMLDIMKKLGGDRVSDVLHTSYPEEYGYEDALDRFDKAQTDEEAVKIIFAYFPAGKEFVDYLKSLINIKK